MQLLILPDFASPWRLSLAGFSLDLRRDRGIHSPFVPVWRNAIKSCFINDLYHPDGKDRAIGTLTVRVQAGARRDRILGYAGDQLRVAIQAPAVEGAANRALVRFLAKTLGVSRSGIRLVKGERSRLKILEIKDLAPEELEQRLHEINADTDRAGI